jgi:DNA mismatch endonuclease (patch repair protein)
MRANKKRDTEPEVKLRRIVHRLGLRYRLGQRIFADPPVVPDMVFGRAKVAVFVDGCFWHGCPLHGVQPRTNEGYWGPKIARNRERDRRIDEGLTAAGWMSVRIWEHEDPRAGADRLKSVVAARLSRAK